MLKQPLQADQRKLEYKGTCWLCQFPLIRRCVYVTHIWIRNLLPPSCVRMSQGWVLGPLPSSPGNVTHFHSFRCHKCDGWSWYFQLWPPDHLASLSNYLLDIAQVPSGISNSPRTKPNSCFLLSRPYPWQIFI